MPNTFNLQPLLAGSFRLIKTDLELCLLRSEKLWANFSCLSPVADVKPALQPKCVSSSLCSLSLYLPQMLPFCKRLVLHLHFKTYSFIHLLLTWGNVSAAAYIWRSEDNSWGVGSPLPWCGSGDQTQAVRLSGKCLFLLSHLLSPVYCKELYCNERWENINSEWTELMMCPLQ